MDITERNIKWPNEEELKTIMSPNAIDLINKMIQVETTNRLGHNLESLKVLK